MQRFVDLRKIFVRGLFVWAALILSLGPSFDAIAGAAKISVQAGDRSVVLSAVAALDVIDDTLDHLPGKSSGEVQQQQLAVPMTSSVTEVSPPPRAGACCWTPLSVAQPPSHPSESPERPPRA